MARRGRPAKEKKEVKKEEPKQEEIDVAEDGDETKESMPPVAEHLPDAGDLAPAVEEVPVEEPVEEKPVEVPAVPACPVGAPDPKDVALEYENQGHRIYKMKGTGGYRKNQKVIIKIEE